MANVTDTINIIMRDIERGIPKDVAVAYHTANVGGASVATQAREVNQTINVSRRDVATQARVVNQTINNVSRRNATIEEMSEHQLLRELRKMVGRYNYPSIAEHMRVTAAEHREWANGSPFTAQAVRGWCLGSGDLHPRSTGAIRRFLIKHRDDRGSLDLRPAGLRAGPRG